MKIKKAIRGARQVALPMSMKLTPRAAALDATTRQAIVAVLAKILIEAAAPRDEVGDERS